MVQSYEAINNSKSEWRDDLRAEYKRRQTSLGARTLPLYAVLVGIVTYITCRTLAHVTGSYLGGISWPFFSDCGRDKPSYYVFLLGAILEASLTIGTLYYVYHRMKGWYTESREVLDSMWLERLCNVGCVLGGTAQVSLICAAFFGTSSHPLLHQAAANTYFCLSTLSLLSFMAFMRIISEIYPENHDLRVSARAKTVVFLAFLTAFIIYIPVGIAITCPARLLEEGECIEVEHLSVQYCESNLSDTQPHFTTLWTYKDCPELFTMRTIAQFCCIITVLFFNATFALDLRRNVMFLSIDANELSKLIRRSANNGSNGASPVPGL